MEDKLPLCPITHSHRTKLLENINTDSITECYKGIIQCTREELFGQQSQIAKYRSIDTGYEFFHPFDIIGSEKLYHKLQQNEWYYMDDKWEYIEALKYIDRNDEVLEIGCGKGAFLRMLKTRQMNEPVGLELSEGAIRLANRSGLDVHKSTIQEYSRHKASFFDVVCFFQVLEHIADVHDFIKSAIRAVKPGGKLIICVPNNDSFIKYDKRNALNLPPHHMGRWNQNSLIQMARVFHLDVEKVEKEPLQAYHIEWYVRVVLQRLFGDFLYFRAIRSSIIEQWIKSYVRRKRIALTGHSILAVLKVK